MLAAVPAFPASRGVEREPDIVACVVLNVIA